MNQVKLLFYFLLFLLPGFAGAQQQSDSIIYLSHHLNNGILNIETSKGLVQVLAYTPQIIEVKKYRGNLPEIDSGSSGILALQNPKLTVEEKAGILVLKTENLTIAFNKNPFYTAFIGNDTLIKEKNGLFEISDKETFYGLGWNADFPLQHKKYQLNNSNNPTPLLLSSKKYLLLFDNPKNGYLSLDESSIKWSFDKRIKKYFFIYGNDFKDLLIARRLLMGNSAILTQKRLLDLPSNWKQLQSLLPKLFNAGISGCPYFEYNNNELNVPDKELAIRRNQLAVLTSLGFKGGLETSLGWRLEPYVKSLTVQAALKGYPVVRPLFVEYPKDRNTFTISSEFMLGKQLLVAPVLKQGEKVRSVYLPRGNRWYNFFTNRKLPGGREYDIPVTINDVPVFVRAGAFLPLLDDADNLNVAYYMSSADARQTFVLYEMNDKSPEALQKGEFEALMLMQKPDVRGNPSFMFSRVNKGYKGMPVKRDVKMEIVGLQKVKKLLLFLNNEEMKRKKPSKKGNGYYFDKEKKVWVVEFEWAAGDAILTTKVKD